MKKGEGETRDNEQQFPFQRADVLLVHTKGSLCLPSKIIRFGTNSYWNHAAMIYLVPNESDGFKGTFVIESLSKGIDIRKLDQYLARPDKYDIGIKRLAAEWYGDGSSEDAVKFARLARGFALQEIDDTYAWGVIARITKRWIRLYIRGVMRWLKGFRRSTGKWMTAKKSQLLRMGKKYEVCTESDVDEVIEQGLGVKNYICSGFVQWAYFQAMAIIKDGPHDSAKFDFSQVVLSPMVRDIAPGKYKDIPALRDKLLSTTPADLANSSNLRWQVIIKDGRLFHAGSGNQPEIVTDILTGKIKNGRNYDFKDGKLISQGDHSQLT